MIDVAARAGVAVGTVSNVLNNPGIVAERTRGRVQAAIDELGFVRNSAARSLVAGSTGMIGLVLVDIGNSFFVDIARGAEATTAAADLKLLLANSDVDQTRQDSYLELFDEARADGLLLAPLDGPLTVAHTVQAHGRPVVLVNVPAIDEAMCSVVVNEELGGYLAARHLLDQGATDLAFTGGPFRLRAISQRLQGALRAVNGTPATLRVHETTGLQIRDGREAGARLLTGTNPVDGIICASDPLAVGVVHTATELGVTVPGRLLVIGYDDNHFAAESVIPISSVSQPGRRMGEVATELLLEEIKEGEGHHHRAVILDPHVVARRSTVRSDVSRPAVSGAGQSG